MAKMTEDLLARKMAVFERYANRGANSECWIWSGPLAPNGYGMIFLSDVKCRAHRFSYEISKGPIPGGLVLDHLCRVRNCVNPDHLEAVTNKTNILRGVSFSAINAVKTECHKGHPLTPENTKVARGWRSCRICARENDNAYNQRKREKKALTSLITPHAGGK